MSKSDKTDKVKITPAKGRPMLNWVGKRPLTGVTAFPAQHIETFDPVKSGHIYNNRLIHGDNKEVLAHLLANGYRGKVDLIYADPPFNTGVDNYVRNVRLRKMKIAGINGEPISLMEQIQYENYYFPDVYLQFLFDRLKLMYELLSETGNLFRKRSCSFG